jgi:hypothetical protein
MNIRGKIILILFLTTSSSVFAADYVGLQCGFKFDGLDLKNSFIIDMKSGVSEYKLTNREGKISGKTNLETIVAPSQITIKEPDKMINIIHRISRESLSYERNRTTGPAMKKLGVEINGTDVGECKIVEVDTSSNQF